MPWGKRADLIIHGDSPLNAEPPRAVLADEAVTPLEAFYVRNHGPVPVLDPSTWRLRVDGLVERELEFSLDELRSRFARHEIAATLQCAGNRRVGFVSVRDIPGEAPWGPGAIGTALWSGVRLTDLLAAAGLHEKADTSPSSAPMSPRNLSGHRPSAPYSPATRRPPKRCWSPGA